MSLIRGHPCLGWGLKAARMQGSAAELSNQNQSAVMGSHSREGWKAGQNSVLFLVSISFVWAIFPWTLGEFGRLRLAWFVERPPWGLVLLLDSLLLSWQACSWEPPASRGPTAETWSVPTEPIVIETEWASIEAVIWVWHFTCALSSVHDNLVRYEWLVLYWRWD